MPTLKNTSSQLNQFFPFLIAEQVKIKIYRKNYGLFFSLRPMCELMNLKRYIWFFWLFFPRTCFCHFVMYFFSQMNYSMKKLCKNNTIIIGGCQERKYNNFYTPLMNTTGPIMYCINDLRRTPYLPISFFLLIVLPSTSPVRRSPKCNYIFTPLLLS